MFAVAKRFQKSQVTVRLNPLSLKRLDALGERQWKNRSQMIDIAIEAYVRSHWSELPPEDRDGPVVQRDENP